MMNTSQNTTIIMLSVTAMILTAMLITATFIDNQPAYAGTEARQGRYIAATASYSSTVDLIYVIDVENRVLQTYAPNTNRNTIEVVGRRVELDRVFGGR